MSELSGDPSGKREDEGLPDLPVTDLARLPPDEGDAGATDLTDETGPRRIRPRAG